jgi:cytoskeletal protein CcmA (bactofilin family)
VPEDFSTIGAAVESVPSGSTIELTQSYYSGDGNRDLVVTKTVTIRSMNGDAGQCVVDVGGAVDMPHRFAWVTGDETVDGALTIEGVELRNGHVSGDGLAGSGGALLVGPDGSAVLAECVLRECDAAWGGGFAVVSSTGSLEVEGCEITACEAWGGGGGGGVSGTSSFSASGSLFWGNWGHGSALAGAVGVTTQRGVVIDHCTLVGNKVDGTLSALGTAIGVSSGCVEGVVIANSVIVNGLVPGYGTRPAVGCTGGGAATASCSNVWGNDGGDWVDCLSSSTANPENLNMNEDPDFCDAPAGDFGSDLLCCVEECGQVGAYGACQSPKTLASAVRGALLELVGRHPGRGVVMRYEVGADVPGSSVGIAVYDVVGRRVRTLPRDSATEGTGVVRWDGRADDGSRSPSGVYMIRLAAFGRALCQRRVVLIW